MVSRFAGCSKRKVAQTASLECQAGVETCYAVLFLGKPIKSLATQRVAEWAKREGFRIKKPGGHNTPASALGGTVDLDSTLAALEAAEKAVLQ
jgi:hypothetical protein